MDNNTNACVYVWTMGIYHVAFQWFFILFSIFNESGVGAIQTRSTRTSLSVQRYVFKYFDCEQIKKTLVCVCAYAVMY